MLDVTLLGALLGGLLVFFSPCVLPIVPFYLSYMAGASVSEISGDGTLAPGVRLRAVLASVMFSLGILTVFVLLGAAAYGLSQTFRSMQTEFRLFAAIVVFIMGLHFLGVIRIGFLNRVFQLEAGDTTNIGIGMTAPFIAASLFIGPFLKFVSRFRQHLPKVEKAMGLLLILFAVLIATDSVNYIAQWMLEAFPAFQKI